ncbi:MAG TPA: hypothetical protein VLA82_03630 [Actinomycetota bacterium]|nr:hypothetical protein [Actinomycetota bacterium]
MLESFDPLRIVAALRAADVRHVLVGDLAAMAHGAPVEADRVEVCVSGEEANVVRLGLCLETLGARPGDANDDPHRATFETSAGLLTCTELSTVEEYEALEARASEIDLGAGVRTKVAAPSNAVPEIRDADDLVAVVRAASFDEDDDDGEVPAFLRLDDDEFGPDPEPSGRAPWRKVWKAFEDVDRFLTGVTEGRGTRVP